MKYWRRSVALACILALLTSCSLLTGRGEQVAVYAPHFAAAYIPSKDSRLARAWQLAIAEPQALAPYDGTRIVVMPTAGEIQFYRGARWRDAAPAVLQDMMLQAHEDLVGATAPGSGMRADFALRTMLRDFRAEYRVGSRAPTVVITMSAQFIAVSTGRVVASRVFTSEEPAADASVPNVFVAFEHALNRLLGELVAWSLDAGDAAWNKPSLQ